MKQVTIDSSAGGKPGTVWFPLMHSDVPAPRATSTQVLIKMLAGALNHRDVFQRQASYPNLSNDSPVGADGVGIVVEAKGDASLQGKRVILMPCQGWEADPRSPESAFTILGGQKNMPGTFVEYNAIESTQVFECPAHLSDAEAAAFPLAGLTAWRAVFTKGGLTKGMKVLITGIGGGVALAALQFAIAAGAEVWVTSGSEEKLERAISLGAKGGINYKTEKWGKALAKQLGGAKFDLVIDSAGGNIVADVLPVIQQGAPIVSYGMTVAPKITFSMNAILMNIEYRGSTMGSKREFKEMIDFVAKHQIKPIVHKVYQGLEQAEDAFVEMRDGHQFGKIVVQVARSDSSKL